MVQFKTFLSGRVIKAPPFSPKISAHLITFTLYIYTYAYIYIHTYVYNYRQAHVV